VPIYEYQGIRPTIAADAFIAPTASIIGDVTIEAGASVWYGAVVRGDDGPIVLRERCNVQDGSIVHTTPDVLTEIGVGATVAHRCVVHGAVLETEALVGNGSVVLDGARIGAGSLVAAMSLVQSGMQVPPGMLVAGVPAVVKKPIAGTPAEMWVKLNPTWYPDLAQKHLASVREIG